MVLSNAYGAAAAALTAWVSLNPLANAATVNFDLDDIAAGTYTTPIALAPDLTVRQIGAGGGIVAGDSACGVSGTGGPGDGILCSQSNPVPFHTNQIYIQSSTPITSMAYDIFTSGGSNFGMIMNMVNELGQTIESNVSMFPLATQGEWTRVILNLTGGGEFYGARIFSAGILGNLESSAILINNLSKTTEDSEISPVSASGGLANYLGGLFVVGGLMYGVASVTSAARRRTESVGAAPDPHI